MTRIAQGQSAQYLDHTRLSWRRHLPGLGITNQNVREIGRIQQTILAFQKYASNLFHHSVKVVDAPQTGGLAKTGLEFFVADCLRLEFLPPAAVNQDAVGKVQAQAVHTLEKVLPNHEGEAEQQEWRMSEVLEKGP